MEVSVVIPALDPGPLLAEQLDALRKQQGAPSFEVVIADNGTRDGSLAGLAEFRPDLDVRVVDASQQRGPSYARNRGAAAARGEWLAFCDADDVANPTWLAGLWRCHQPGVIVTGPCEVTTLNAPELLMARGGAEYGRKLPDGPCDFLPFAHSGNVLVSRADFERWGTWDVTLPYCEDVDLSWRAQLAGARLAFAEEAVMNYRYRPSPRALFHQVRRYKAAEVELYVRYQTAGARRPTPQETIHWYWWLLSRSPYVAMGPRRRHLWWSVAGTVVGRLQGSLACRVVYL